MQEARERRRRNSSRCLFFFRACREDSNILLFPSVISFSQRQMLVICNSTEESSLHKSRIRHRNCLWKFWEKITIAESHVHRIGRSTHTKERARERYWPPSEWNLTTKLLRGEEGWQEGEEEEEEEDGMRYCPRSSEWNLTTKLLLWGEEEPGV